MGRLRAYRFHSLTQSPSQFNEYLLKHNFHVFNAKEIQGSKPYRMMAIFGPPNVGKNSAAGGMNTYVQGVQVTTTSKKFYKYINETSNSNLYHFCNGSFSSPSDINWDRLLQSINSIIHGVGRGFTIEDVALNIGCRNWIVLVNLKLFKPNFVPI